ncbi:MAG TPA: stage II sporulation protein D, partial [Desulfobacteria bacterium]|nr:stage II sporulation protein D [Desulfobacteria bacterium]
MKKFITLIFSFILICLFGVPLVVFYGTSGSVQEKQVDSQTVRVLDKQTGQIKKMPIEEYLIGVVAAEMPAQFELEALKAQAVAARTYTVKRMFAFGSKPNPQHPKAEVCTDPTHCQAWLSTDEQKKNWGRMKYYTNINRIKRAVKLTNNLVITYNGEFIDPVYHASCGGKGTENSEDVWSGQVPYLRGVSCESEYKAGQQKINVVINRAKLNSTLSENALIPVLSKSSGEFIVTLKKSPQGRVQEAAVTGKKISGTELRKILGLGSTFMNWEIKGDKVHFSSTGKGHAVGMCQYGANGMALKGITW